MDSELSALCLVATRNWLYRKFARDMAAARQMMHGLEFDDSSLYEVHPTGEAKEWDEPNLYVTWPAENELFGENFWPSCGCACWAECFEHDKAQQVWLEGVKVFEKQDGEWMYVEVV